MQDGRHRDEAGAKTYQEEGGGEEGVDEDEEVERAAEAEEACY